MKISDIQLTPLKIGKTLIRIQTDSGIEGWAEAPGGSKVVPGRSVEVFKAYLEQIIKPVLIGEDPLEIDRHWETLALGKEDRMYKLPANVVGAIDIALWDLMGKEAGMPVYKLMGGAILKDAIMSENIRMDTGMGRGYLLGQMDKSMKGIGKMDFFMVKEY